MAEEDTSAPVAYDPAQIQALIERLGIAPPAPPQHGAPGQGGLGGFLGDVGKAFAGGGSGLLDLSPGESDTAGAHALLRMGTNMLMASGPSYVPRGLGEIIGYGLQGAQEGYQGTELATAQRLAAQQEGQQQQFQNRLASIKEAIPLLTMQRAASIPNVLAGSGPGGGGKPGTSIADYVDPVTAMPREKALDALAQRESGGKNVPNAEGGDASGYWQIRDATWRDGAKLAGVDTSQYPRAIAAPQDVQRKVAGALYDKYGAMPWAASAPGRPTQTAAAAPPAAPGGPATPPPYKVAGPTQPPPAATTAPQKVGDLGLVRNPDGTVGTPNAGGLGTGGTTAPADSTTTPPPAPTKQTFEQFQALHPVAADPGTEAGIAGLEKAKQQAAVELQASVGPDRVKAVTAYNAAAKAVTDARTAAAKEARDTQRQLYDAEMQRQQAAEEADKGRAATAAEAEKNRAAQVALETQKSQAAIEQSKITAGQTFHQKQEEETAQQANTNTIAPMAAQAIKAHELNLGLSQLQTVLPNLPKGGGMVGALLDAHPDIAPLLNTAGVLNDRQADAVRLLTGLTASLSTAMKPAGLGALREYEFDAFKAQLPNLLSTPDGQQKALAYLMNLNDRVQKEAQWTQQYYNRRIPDETAQKPGATRRALNLDTEEGGSWQQKMDKELGPLVPSYTPPQGQPGSASGQAAWEASLPPGKPFYRTYRDGTTSLEFKPWR